MHEKAVLIGLITPNVTSELVAEYLLELDFLARTAGAETVKQFTQKLPHPDNKTFLGKGKTEEVRLFAEENEIDIIIFDDELSPSQLRNVEAIYGCKILDRNNKVLALDVKGYSVGVDLSKFEYSDEIILFLSEILDKQPSSLFKAIKGKSAGYKEISRNINLQEYELLQSK